MGVQYGADAVAGVINIITKKSANYKWQIRPYLQEETSGDECGWFDKGRHIQSLSVSNNISEKLYANITVTRNDFAGLWGDKQGESYQYNDGKRGYEWLPKLQYNTKGMLSYQAENMKMFYKFEYFNEKVSRYDSVVRENYNPSTQTRNPISSDEIFTSQRFMHHLNANGSFNSGILYNVSLSFQQQKKNAEQQRLEDGKADIGWGSQIRSYVLDQSRIKDLRTGVEVSNTQKVLDGDLNGFISASLKSGL